MDIVNLKLLSHPMNWLTVFFMLILAGVAGHLILSWAGIEPKSVKSPNGAPVSSGLVPSSQTTVAVSAGGNGVTMPMVIHDDSNGGDVIG